MAGVTSRQVTVGYADATTGTATSGTDYTAVTAGTLTFAAGDSAKTVTVAVTGDTVDEPNETVVLQLSSPSNATLAGGVTTLDGTGTITDDDGAPALSISSPSVEEGDSGTADLEFVVTLTGSTSQQVTVAYADSETGTATSGTDYSAVTAGTLTFAAGDTSKTVTVTVTGDTVDEPNETVVLRLSSPSNATLAGGVTTLDGTGTITDDDGAPALSISSPSVEEGDSGTADLEFVVSLTGSTSRQVTVGYADATTGTATSGTDYTAVTAGTLTFAVGDSAKTVTVAVTGDTIDERHETVVLRLSSPSNATLTGGVTQLDGTGTITDDDAELSISSPSVTEGDSGTADLEFVVSLAGVTSQQVTVGYADATTGTATSGTDYTAVTAGTLTFAAGDTSKTVTVSVTGDTVDEPNETVVLRLSSPSNATLAGGVTTLDGTGTITDDDGAPELSISSPSVEEGDSGTADLEFVVTLTGSTSQQVTVAYADSETGTATSGTDYSAVTAGTLTFAAGDTSKTVTVTVTGDTVDEPNETVVLRLSSPSNATLAGGVTTLDGTGTITDDDGAPALSISSPSVEEGDSGTADLEFVVSLTGSTSRQVTVGYADATTGTATSGTDYTAVTAGTLTFAVGDSAKTVTVAVTGDTIDERHETVVLRLSSPSNATLTGGVTQLDGTGTITDDDAELSISSPSVTEGDSGTADLEFVVSLAGVTSQQVTVGYADATTGTATSGTDYTAVTAGTLTFAAGDTSKTVTVSVTGDTVDEPNETVVLRLSSPSNATLAGGVTTLDGTGTITDDDGAPELSISSPSVEEGDSGTANLEFVVSLAGVTSRQVTVGYADATTGTATSGTDYTAVTAGTLTFAAGDSAKTVTVAVTGDTVDEPNETVVLRLSSPSNATLAGGVTTLDGTGTITDDDGAPELSISSPSVEEGDSGTADLEFVVTLTGSTSQQVTVAYADSETGTATSGTDYSAVTAGTLTFAAGDTSKTVTVAVTGDTVDEPNETVVLRLSSPSNATLAGEVTQLDGTGTITDDDGAPALSISSPSVEEGDSGTADLEFVVTLTGSTSRQVTVGYADATTGTATSGTDYTAVTAGTLTFAAGDSAKTVTVAVTGDTVDEPNETVVLQLSSPSNATLAGGVTQLDGTGTITDDDAELSISSPSVTEGDSGTADLEFVVSLAGVTSQQVTVGYADATTGTATSGTDYTAVTAGTLSFAAGDTSKTVTVSVTGDTVDEPNETVVLRLSSPSNATLAGGVTELDGTGTITDDDGAPELSISSPSVAEGDSGTADLEFVVTLTGSTSRQVTVGYADATTGTATSGTDYTAVTAGTLTFAVGDSAKTVTVAVTGDTIDEPNETVVLRLSSPSNATLTGGVTELDGTGTITDDDGAPELSISSPSVAEGDSGTADLAFVVTLTGSTSQQVTVAYADAGTGTATSGTDYTAVTAGTLTFAAGDSAKTVTVAVTGDTVDEPNETVVLQLSSPSNATLTGGVTELDGTGTITDDDGAPELSISSPSVAEGDSRTANLEFVVSLAGVTSQQVTVAYADTGTGTAASGTDYTAVTAGTLTFAAGDTAKTVTVAVTGDTVDEPNETVVLRLSSPSNATLSGGASTLDGTGTITDDDAATAVSLEISPTSVAESADATSITVTASLVGSQRPAATAVTVSQTGGTATSGTDYVAISAFTVTIAAGASSGTATLRFDPTEDTLEEENETVVLSGSASGLTAGTATLTITDNDGAPTAATLSALTGTTSTDGTNFSDGLNIGAFASLTTSYTAIVTNAVTHVKLTPTVTESSATVAIGRQGSALVPVTSGQASLAIALGDGLTAITVRVTAQDTTTQDYTVSVTRQAQSALTARPSAAPATHDGSAAFSIRLEFSEAVTITDEAAFRDHSVEALGGTVTDAERLDGSVWDVTVDPDGGGAVVVALLPTGGCADPGALCTTDGRPLSARVEAMVRGPDTGIVTVSPVAAAITEGEPARFRLRRSGGTGYALTVGLRVTGTGTGADDFIQGSPPTTARFEVGEAEILLDIPTAGDALAEPGALLTVELSEDSARPPDYVLGGARQAVLQVHDDDGGENPPPLPGTGTPPPVRRTPLPLQLALWTDRPGYLAGETVRLFHTLDPHDDRRQYRVFAWLEPAAGGDRRYLAPLSADAELHPEAVDIRGLPEHASQAGLLPRADKALAWDGESLAPGLWRFVLELRPGSADEQYEKPAEPMRTRRAWAAFTVAERSQGLNRSGIDREIRTDATLRSDTLYYLGHQLFVQDGATLTIEPGTVVLGWGRNTAIIVEPGGRIVAEGTCEAPVVLGCSAPVGQREPGCWGGLRILGRAPVTRLEGVAPGVLPADRAVYGGTDAQDSSGVLQYVRVEYAGAGGGPEAPAPAVGIYGAGSGTVLDHVQARGSLGAGIAFSGGTARCDHCVSSGSGTAGLAWERGWRGGASHLYVHHGSRGYDGLAGRNDDQGHDLEPRSVPTLSNVTLVHAWPYGRRERAAVALRLSAGSGVRVRNLLATRFSGGAVEAGGRSRLLFEDGESSVDSALLFLNGSPQMRDGLRVAVEFADRDPKLRDVRDFANPDPRPKTGSPALTNGGEGYIGAFDEEDNWLEEWTVFGPESAYHLQERGR